MLALAYSQVRGIPALEDAIAATMGGTLAPELRQWVVIDTSREFAAYIGGEALRGCPWDSEDSHPLRRSLARYWHECLETLLEGYRSGVATVHPSARLVDEYVSDGWMLQPRITAPRRRV